MDFVANYKHYSKKINLLIYTKKIREDFKLIKIN